MTIGLVILSVYDFSPLWLFRSLYPLKQRGNYVNLQCFLGIMLVRIYP